MINYIDYLYKIIIHYELKTALSVVKGTKKHLYLISLTLMRFKIDWDVVSTTKEPITDDSNGTLKKLNDLKVLTLKNISPFLHFKIFLTVAISFVVNII